MPELENAKFDAAAFLASAGLGRRIVQLKPQQPSFRRETAQTPFSIFRRAAQNSLSFRQTAKKPLSRFFVPETSSEKSPSQEWWDCAWPLPLRLPPVLRSR